LFLENVEAIQYPSPFTVKNFYSGLELAQLLGDSSHEEIENVFASVFQGTKGHSIVSLAYTEDGENVQIFEGELEGTVVMPKGELGNAWEYPFFTQ
jgi:inosine/xanthosine triphosphate pyrophosphatase family protein